MIKIIKPNNLHPTTLRTYTSILNYIIHPLSLLNITHKCLYNFGRNVRVSRFGNIGTANIRNQDSMKDQERQQAQYQEFVNNKKIVSKTSKNSKITLDKSQKPQRQQMQLQHRQVKQNYPDIDQNQLLQKYRKNKQLQNQAKAQKQIETQKQQVLKTYLQIIPPYKLQAILQPEKTSLTQFIAKSQQLSVGQLDRLYKKIKKSVHIMEIQNLTQVLQIIDVNGNDNQQGQISEKEGTGKDLQNLQDKQKSKALSRKIYTKILACTHKKMMSNVLTLQQIINFVYKLVKLNHKQFQFMKEVQRVIIQQKIKINYPLIRKILFSYTHLDVGSAVLYSHIARTIKIGQHQLGSLELAQAAYMLSKTSQNATGGYGVFLIAEQHLLNHFPRMTFSELVKAASFMLTQNIGTNQFQTQLQSQIYKKFPNRPNLRINQLVSLLKSTSAYYFKYNDKALLNLLKSSTHKLASEANLQQFQDIVWSWGRAGKGDKQLWNILQEQIKRKYLKLLKPRQLAFFYFSLCSTQYSSEDTINLLQTRFLQVTQQNKKINEHYLLKFLLGMQKRKQYSQKSFAKVSKMITDRFQKLTIKQLVTFAKIINESDLCYENKHNFKQMEKGLLKACENAIERKIYMFRIGQLIQLLYMWIKLDVNTQQQTQKSSNQKLHSQKSGKFLNSLFKHIAPSISQIPKSTFIKALFSFTIKDHYKQSLQMIRIMQQLMKYGPVSYFFSPYQLPLAAYCMYHLVVNSNGQIKIKQELLKQMGQSMEKVNPIILNQFVKNGYQECMKLKEKYQQMGNKNQSANSKSHRRERRRNQGK